MQRQGLTAEELDLRMAKAEDEMNKLPLFDYAIVNQKDKINVVVSEILSIVTAEKRRIRTRKIQFQ